VGLQWIRLNPWCAVKSSVTGHSSKRTVGGAVDRRRRARRKSATDSRLSLRLFSSRARFAACATRTRFAFGGLTIQSLFGLPAALFSGYSFPWSSPVSVGFESTAGNWELSSTRVALSAADATPPRPVLPLPLRGVVHIAFCFFSSARRYFISAALRSSSSIASRNIRRISGRGPRALLATTDMAFAITAV